MSFAYSRATVTPEGYEPVSSSTTTFGISAYLGYFVARRFVLGLYLSLPISDTKVDGDSDSDFSWEFGLIAAPGFAIPIGGRAFLFGDGLIGFAVLTQESGRWSNRTTLAYLGAELGLKFGLGANYLVRLGLRPAYLVGKTKNGDDGSGLDASDLRVFLTLGFSGFL